MKTLLLEIVLVILSVKLTEPIQIKNLRLVYKGISKLVLINEKLSIECPITAQFYLWKFYRHQSEPQVLLEQENKFLTIDSVKTEKTGIYECKSTTGFVNTDTNITVKVIDPGSDLFRETCSVPMSSKPADLSKGLCFFNEKSKRVLKYKIGQDAEFDCTGVGTDLKYYWTFTDESGIKDQIQTGYNVSKIIIKSFLPENEGLYKCDIIDKYNQKISQSFKVILSDATSDMNIDIVGDKQDFITTQAGQKINLKCEARNNFDRIHSVKWGKRIKNPASDSVAKGNIVSWDQYTYRLLPVSDIIETHLNPNQLISTLVLAQIDAEHSGVYICLAMDTRGRTVHKIFNLTVSPTQAVTEPSSKSYFFLLYIFLPVILIFACVCIIIYCCVKSSSKKSHTSLPLKKYTTPVQGNPTKEPMPNYYYPVSNNRPPLPQPTESQASLTAPNTLTSYNSYGNYHMQSTNQPSCCSSNGV